MKPQRENEVFSAMEIQEQSSPQHEDTQPRDIQKEVVHTEGVIATSSEINVPEKLIDQVIGQEHAVEVIKKAAVQRRHVMMIGSPGTGKSMLAKAMADSFPKKSYRISLSTRILTIQIIR